MVIDVYLKHVIKKSKETKEEKKSLKLFTLTPDRMSGRRGDVWQSVNLHHPATFDTLAMDMEGKRVIMEDLERFVKRREFYRRVGKAWKRGYLLFGPPGTGKSSLIAAIANYLKFDIYDLELTDLKTNSELRNLLISTENKSVLVVEDIDCSIELQDRLAQARAMMPSRHNPAYNQVNQVIIPLDFILRSETIF
jgi:chaperone BCS1